MSKFHFVKRKTAGFYLYLTLCCIPALLTVTLWFIIDFSLENSNSLFSIIIVFSLLFLPPLGLLNRLLGKVTYNNSSIIQRSFNPLSNRTILINDIKKTKKVEVDLLKGVKINRYSTNSYLKIKHLADDKNLIFIKIYFTLKNGKTVSCYATSKSFLHYLWMNKLL